MNYQHSRTQTRSWNVEELYLRCADDALKTAFLMTGSPVLAEDLVQEAFARAIVRLQHVRDPSAFPAYLRQAVINLSRMHFRKKQTENRYVVANLTPVVGDETDVATTETMRTALLRLPHRQRAAIVLRYYADLPDEESAHILGCSRSTVRSLIARGLAKLRNDLGGDDG